MISRHIALKEILSLFSHVRVSFPVRVRIPINPLDLLIFLQDLLQCNIPWLDVDFSPAGCTLLDISAFDGIKITLRKYLLTNPKMTSPGKQDPVLDHPHSNGTEAAPYSPSKHTPSCLFLASPRSRTSYQDLEYDQDTAAEAGLSPKW